MFRFSDYRKPKVIKVPAPPVYDRSLMSWPLKVTFKAANKEVVAVSRATQLNTVIDVLAEKIKDPTLDAATLVLLTNNFVELQRQYKKLQETFFVGDGRSKRKHRGKKKDGSITDLLK